jgi:hypothetical protein
VESRGESRGAERVSGEVEGGRGQSMVQRATCGERVRGRNRDREEWWGPTCQRVGVGGVRFQSNGEKRCDTLMVQTS